MKNLITAIGMLISTSLFSQNIEFTTGVNSNNFYNSPTAADIGNYSSSFSSGLGYHFGVGIENVMVDWLNLRFTLGLDSYSGDIDARWGGQIGGNEVNAEIQKTVLSLGVYPINFKVKNTLNLNFGVEFSGLIHESMKGTKGSWGILPYTSEDLAESTSYNRKMNFGFAGRLAYDIKLSEEYALSPQYGFYLGLTDEFDEFPEDVSSYRQYFSIGIQKAL